MNYNDSKEQIYDINDDVFENVYKPERPRNYKYHHRKRKRRQRKIIFLCSVIVVLTTIIIWLIVTQLIKSDDNTELQGVFVYDDNTQYEFDGEGNGCMCIENEYHYEYTYTINDVLIQMDFKAPEVHDAVYEYSLSDNILTLVGRDGTTGGTYKLTKAE